LSPGLVQKGKRIQNGLDGLRNTPFDMQLDISDLIHSVWMNDSDL